MGYRGSDIHERRNETRNSTIHVVYHCCLYVCVVTTNDTMKKTTTNLTIPMPDDEYPDYGCETYTELAWKQQFDAARRSNESYIQCQQEKINKVSNQRDELREQLQQYEETETVYVVVSNFRAASVSEETTCEVYTDKENANTHGRPHESLSTGDICPNSIVFEAQVADGTITTREIDDEEGECPNCVEQIAMDGTKYTARCVACEDNNTQSDDTEDEQKLEPVEGVDESLSRELYYQHATDEGDVEGTIHGIEKDGSDMFMMYIDCPDGRIIHQRLNLNALLRVCEYHGGNIGAIEQLIDESIPLTYSDDTWEFDGDAVRDGIDTTADKESFCENDNDSGKEALLWCLIGVVAFILMIIGALTVIDLLTIL